MKFRAEIDVMPHKALLDPQGKAVSASMGNVGLSEITNVRIGKHITLEVEASNESEANSKVDGKHRFSITIRCEKPKPIIRKKMGYSY